MVCGYLYLEGTLYKLPPKVSSLDSDMMERQIKEFNLSIHDLQNFIYICCNAGEQPIIYV